MAHLTRATENEFRIDREYFRLIQNIEEGLRTDYDNRVILGHFWQPHLCRTLSRPTTVVALVPLSFLLSVSQSVVESTAQAETVDRPVNIAMTGAAATSGSLEWNGIASAHSYVYRHKRSSLTSWQDQVEIGTATATVSGLNSVAQYDSRSGRRTMK